MEQMAHASPASATAMPIGVGKSDALANSMPSVMELPMPMERNGILKDATGTIQITPIFNRMLKVHIVNWQTALLMEERLYRVLVRCITCFVNGMATSENTP